MMDENLEMIVMNLVIDSGSCRSYAMEAIAFAKEGQFDEAEEALVNADSEIQKAHHVQTSLIQNEAKGEHTEISLLMVHAQDHLMTAMVVKDLAREFVSLYKKLK